MVGGLVAVLLVAAVPGSTPDPVPTMASALVDTRTAAVELHGLLDAAGLEADVLEMSIVPCEDEGREWQPFVQGRMIAPDDGSDQAAAAERLAAALEDAGWDLSDSPRFDEGVDARSDETTAVGARRGDQDVRLRMLSGEPIVGIDLLGACLPVPGEDAELYEALRPWDLLAEIDGER